MKPPSETAAGDTAVENPVVGIDQSKGDFKYDVNYEFDAGTGLSEKVVDYISAVKKEAPWIREFRQNALKVFYSKPMPTHWATKDLENINFDKIRYYLAQGQKPKRTWDEVPDDIKKTFERLGIPEQERKFLAGVEAQFDSEAAYSNIKEAVAKQGLVYEDFKANMRDNILSQWVIQREVGQRVNIKPEEIKTYFEGHKDEFKRPEGVVLAQILVSTEEKKEDELPALKKKAEDGSSLMDYND